MASGTTSQAVYTELAMHSPQELAIVAPTVAMAEMSLWRFVAYKHTPHALENVFSEEAHGTAQFGSSVTFGVTRDHDLVWGVFAQMELPGLMGVADNVWKLQVDDDGWTDVQEGGNVVTIMGIAGESAPAAPDANGNPQRYVPNSEGAPIGAAGPHPDAWFGNVLDDEAVFLEDLEPHYTNAIGQFALAEISLVLGSHEIHKITNLFLYIWEELAGKPGKRLSEMIGKYDTPATRMLASRRKRKYYTPIPFFFTENTGLALPTVTLGFQSVKITVQTSPMDDCIVKPTNDLVTSWPKEIKVKVRPDGLTNAEIRDAGDTVADFDNLAKSDLNLRMEYFAVHLAEDESQRLTYGQFQQVITQNQYHSESITNKRNQDATAATAPHPFRSKFTFTHIMAEYIIVVRRQIHMDNNEHFNFDGAPDPATEGTALDPFVELGVEFGHVNRWTKRDAQFYRMCTPYMHHTNLTRDFIYVMSYAVDPEDPQPSGGVGHTKLTDTFVTGSLDSRVFNDNSHSAELTVIGRVKNIVQFTTGTMRLMFLST